MSQSIADLRAPYPDHGLTEEAVDADPIVQFNSWLADAIQAGHIESNAMTLATATPDGVPSARVVLLKKADQAGFTFFTNYASRKGQEIAANPQVALVFYWDKLTRQVRVEGTIEKVSAQESDAYYHSRPHGSQIGAWVSHQSTMIENRTILEERWAEVTAQFGDEEIPRPEYWGGYRVVPQRIEFWQGRPSRLHDRLVYTLQADGAWTLARLAP